MIERPPRVVHVIAPAPMGGAEAVVRQLAEAQHRRGELASVVALLDPDGPEPWLVERLREAAVPIAAVRARHRGYLEEIRHIVRAIGEHGANLVHGHAYRGDVLGYVACRRTRAAFVSTAHGFTGGSLKNRFFEALDRWCLRRAARVIVVSQPLLDQLAASGLPKEIIRCIPNGLAPPSFKSRDVARRALGLPDAPIVGFIGRLSEEKGPDLFVRALAQLEDDSVHAAVIGDGSEADEIAALCTALNIGDRVHLLGPIPDASTFMKAFDLFVMSSRTEGMPMVLLEAMFAGVPVVATRVGQIPQALQHGELGTLVEPGDAGGLSARLSQDLADLRAVSERAGRAKARAAEVFSLDGQLEAIAEVYQDALATRR